MEVTGKLIEILEMVTGEGSNGTWQKQSIVLQQPGEYGKPVCIMFWGDKCDYINAMSIGDSITIGVNVESREYNGKYYTDIKAWKVNASVPAGETVDVEVIDETDDLPF